MNVHHLVVALAVLAFLPGPSAARPDTLSGQSRQVVEARGLKGVRVENPRGRVRVVPSPDGRLHVTALKFTRGHRPRRRTPSPARPWSRPRSRTGATSSGCAIRSGSSAYPSCGSCGAS